MYSPGWVFHRFDSPLLIPGFAQLWNDDDCCLAGFPLVLPAGNPKPNQSRGNARDLWLLLSILWVYGIVPHAQELAHGCSWPTNAHIFYCSLTKEMSKLDVGQLSLAIARFPSVGGPVSGGTELSGGVKDDSASAPVDGGCKECFGSSSYGNNRSYHICNGGSWGIHINY